MKTCLAFVLVLISIANLLAYPSGIAIRTDKSVLVQVFVNGKLYNKKPTAYIHIKSTGGYFKLRVKILNLYDDTTQEICQTIRIAKGFEYQFNVVLKEGQKPELMQLKRYPVYSRYLLDYSLYTRSRTS